MATINLNTVNSTATVSTPGSYDINIALLTNSPRVIFAGAGTYTVTNVAGLLSGYTIEASTGANVVINSLASAASAANLQIDANSAITLNSGVNALTVITATFAGTGGTLAINPTLLSLLTTEPSVTGFGAGDHLELGGTGSSGYTTTYNSTTNQLVLLQNGTQVGAVRLVGTYSAANFAVGTDGSGNTQINFVACFLRGTRITTPQGEVAVESLCIGDLVTVAGGGARPVKWIGRRAYHPAFARRNPEILPVCIRAGALAEATPARDLYVSPRHAMAIDGLLVQAIELVNGRSIVQETSHTTVEYFHIELGEHAVIFAEGAAAESYVVCENRHIFQNFDEYVALYGPDPVSNGTFCAPLIDGGPLADAARARLALRAGLAPPNLRTVYRLLGFVDRAGDGGVVEGWAMDEVWRDVPLVLDIMEDGQLLARVVADRYRPDLAAQGAGPGRHGFRITLPALAQSRRIEVRRSLDGAVLDGSFGTAQGLAA